MSGCYGLPSQRPRVAIIKSSEPSQICPPLCFTCPLPCPAQSPGPKPIKTEVYLRPDPLCPPTHPMPCPPKVQVITMPSVPPPPPPPAVPQYCVTIKRIPVQPPPPPTPPISSPCRAICNPLMTYIDMFTQSISYRSMIDINPEMFWKEEINGLGQGNVHLHVEEKSSFEEFRLETKA